MENLSARIRIRHQNGTELAYIYESSAISQLDLLPSQYAEEVEKYLNIGETVTIARKKFKIINIFSRFFAKVKQPLPQENNLTLGKPSFFNFEIIYMVTES